MTKLVQIISADGRVKRFDPVFFISARDSSNGTCIVELKGETFGTTKSAAAEVEAAVKEALSGGG